LYKEKKSFLGTYQAKRVLWISFAANFNAFLKDHFHLLEIKKLFPIETDPQQKNINQSYYSNSNPKSLEAK
jgi:hypothetical protein